MSATKITHGCLTAPKVNAHAYWALRKAEPGKCSSPDCPVCWPKPLVMWAGADEEDAEVLLGVEC
jgi:hypothetical protein